MNDDKQENPTYQTNKLEKERVRVRLRVGDKEMEIEGPQEYVNQQAGMFLSHLVSSNSNHNGNLLVVGEENHVVVKKEATTTESTPPSPPVDIIAFFREKSPTSQKDEVLLITYFYQKYLGRETLTLDDYTEAYTVLRRLAVDVPSNMKSSVRNLVDRTKFLYNPERGKYGLTLLGEQLVDDLGGNDNG